MPRRQGRTSATSRQSENDSEGSKTYERSREEEDMQQGSFQSQSSDQDEVMTSPSDRKSTRGPPSRFSTRSADARKPWLGGSSSSPPEGRQSVSRTSSDHVLHLPRQSKTSETPTGDDNGGGQTLEEARSFDDLWDESNREADDHGEITPAENPPKEKSRPAEEAPKKPSRSEPAAVEFDTRRFAKNKITTPPNTPMDEDHATAEEMQEDPVEEEPPQKEHPIRHHRKESQSSADKPSRAPRRKSSNEGLGSDRTRRSRHPHKIKQAPEKDQPTKEDEVEKPKRVYENKDEAIASLEKQLDRVSFLQRRQYEQLSSLKEMLLASRAKEREHLDTNEELGKALEAKEAQIEALEQQMESQSSIRDLRNALKEKDARIKQLEANPIPAIQFSSEDIERKLKAKDEKIAELQYQVEAKDSEMENSLAVAQSKLKKKTESNEQLHVDLEDMRNQLTKAQTTIETLEEERNFSQAKMSQLNDMVNQKGGMSNAESELLERAAEIANLSSKLSGLDGKIQERDDKIYKLEEEIKNINDLVRQLSDIFCAEDDQLKYQQDLLVESADSPAQSCSLLLMTMMNMLETLKNKLATLKQERDDSNAKASDRGIQLAESHIRVDKLRTELRRLRAERARLRQVAPNLNDPRNRGQPPPGARPQQGGSSNPQGSPVTPNQGKRPDDAPTPPRSNVQNPRQYNEQRRNSLGNTAKLHNGSEKSHQSRSSISTAPQAGGAPAPKQSRFMSFIKNQLKHEEAPPEPQNGRRPMVAMT